MRAENGEHSITKVIEKKSYKNVRRTRARIRLKNEKTKQSKKTPHQKMRNDKNRILFGEDDSTNNIIKKKKLKKNLIIKKIRNL